MKLFPRVIKTRTTLVAVGLLSLFSDVSILQAERPNSFFVLVDDLGSQDLGYTGSTFYESPNIDALAAAGIRQTPTPRRHHDRRGNARCCWLAKSQAKLPASVPRFAQERFEQRTEKVRSKLTAKLERQHATFLEPDYAPKPKQKKAWWGSAPE